MVLLQFYIYIWDALVSVSIKSHWPWICDKHLIRWHRGRCAVKKTSCWELVGILLAALFSTLQLEYITPSGWLAGGYELVFLDKDPRVLLLLQPNPQRDTLHICKTSFSCSSSSWATFKICNTGIKSCPQHIEDSQWKVLNRGFGKLSRVTC